MSTTPRKATGRNRTRITREHRRNAARVWARLKDLFGGPFALAEAIKVKPPTLYKYRRRWPAEVVLDLERACIARLRVRNQTSLITDLRLALAAGLSRHDIRPDIYPNDGGYSVIVKGEAVHDPRER